MRATLISTKAINDTLLKEVVLEVLGPLEDASDVKSLVAQLTLPDFELLKRGLRKLKNVEAVKDLTASTIVQDFAHKFYVVQNHKTSCAKFKAELIDIKHKWQEVLHLFNAFFSKEKSHLLLQPTIARLRNKESQQASIEANLAELVDTKVKLDLAYLRIEQAEKEIADTFLYLENTYSTLSRQFSILQLRVELEK